MNARGPAVGPGSTGATDIAEGAGRTPTRGAPRTVGATRRDLLVGAALSIGGSLLSAGLSATRALAAPALPPLPLPAGARIAAFGDSYVQRSGYSVRRGDRLRGYSLLARGSVNLLASIDPRFRVEVFMADGHPYQGPKTDNELTGSLHGLGGDRLSFEREGRPGYLERIGYCLDRKPDVVVIETAGANNVGDADPAKLIITELEAVLRRIREAGVHAVVFTLPFMDQWDDKRRAIAEEVNTWLAEQAASGREGFHLADTRAIEATAAIAPGHFSDGAHRSPAGTAAVVNAVLLPVMRTLVSEGTAFDPDPLSNNLFPAPGLPGAEGTFSTADGDESDLSGDLASGLHLRREKGRSRVTCAKAAAGAGTERQIFTFEPNGGDEGVEEFRLTLDIDGGVRLSDLGVRPETDWGMEFLLPVELDDSPGWLMPAKAGGGPVSLRAETVGAKGNDDLVDVNNAANFLGGHYILRILLPFGKDARPEYLRWGRRHRPIRIFFDPTAGTPGVLTLGSPVWRRLTTSPAADWAL